MGRNAAIIGRREVEAHRRVLPGVTASVPRYLVVDSAGNKEWLVDVYIGPIVTDPEPNIMKNVPIAPYAKQLIGDIRQPVALCQSKQGKWTVVGREKLLSAGAQDPDGSILEPTNHEVQYNLAALGLTFIADVDYVLAPYQADPGDEYQALPTDPHQVVDAFDAFGFQVLGPAAAAQKDLVDPVQQTVTTTKHTVLQMAKYGPFGDPDALQWGVSEYQPAVQKQIELVT